MIRGTLDDFSLPEIIRLIASGRRSGILELKGATGAGRLLFENGQVRGAESSYAREPIGRKLIRLSAVSEEDVWSVLERQGTERTPIGRAMVVAGLVDDDQLAVALEEQMEEDVLNLLRLNPREFVWTPGSVPGERPGVPAEVIIAAVTRRLAEFRSLRRLIPSDDALVSLSPLPQGASRDIHLSPSQWRLLALLGGRRIVRDVLRYSGSGDIQTLRVLGDLIAGGLIEVQEAEAVPETSPAWEVTLDRMWPSPPGSGGPPSPEPPRVIRLPDEGEGAPARQTASFEVALLGAGNRLFGPLAAGWLHQLLGGGSVRVRSLGVQDLPSLPPPVEVIDTARQFGLEVAGHRTEQVRAGSLRGTDLVLGWDRFDVDTAVALGGAARERAFTLVEFGTLVRGVRAPEGSDLPTRARLLVARAHRARADGGREGVMAPDVAAHNNNGGSTEAIVARIRGLCVTVGDALLERGARPRTGPPPPPPPPPVERDRPAP